MQKILPAQNKNTTIIDIDNVGGAQMAVEHLISLGHTRIAHLGGPTQRLAADHRLQGYRQALENAGILYDESLVLRCSPSIRGGLEFAMTILQEKKPSALFCYNDLMAVGAMVACRQLDLNIPRDVAVVGFDDIAIASLVEPALTTVRVRQYDMGKLASELLLERLSGKEGSQDVVKFPVELIIRNSCGDRRMSSQAAKRNARAPAASRTGGPGYLRPRRGKVVCWRWGRIENQAAAAHPSSQRSFL